jgi:hypothetical protein
MATRRSSDGGGTNRHSANGRQRDIHHSDSRGARARGVDMDKVRAHHEKLSSEQVRFGDVTFWEPTSGPKGTVKKNYIRILPPWSDDNIPYREIAYHYGVVEKRALVCPRKTYSEPCPICEAADGMFETGRDEDKEIGKKLNSRRRYFYNIIDRDDEAKGVQVFGCGVTIHRAITGLFNDPDWGDITDPEEGFDVIIERAGTGRDTEYPTPGSARRMPSPLGTPEQMDEWLGGLFDLDALVRRESYEDLKLALEDPEDYIAKKEAAEDARKTRQAAGDPPPASRKNTGSANSNNSEDDRLVARARELGIEWDGTPTARDLRAWIAEEEAKQPPPAARRASSSTPPPTARRNTSSSYSKPSRAGDTESLNDEINKTLAERQGKRR